MRAIVHDTAGPAVVEHPEPAAGTGEVIVSTLRVLLDPSDHASAARRRGHLGVPGRRMVGTAPDGTRTAIDPEIPCGRCRHCRSGLSGACPQRASLGARGRDGGLAERIAVPEPNLVRLPAGLDPDVATLAGPVGLGLGIARRLRLAEDAHLSVIGDGTAALAAAAALASRHPATRLLSDDPFTAAVAAKWSLKHRGVSEAGRRHDQEAIAILDATGGSNEALVAAAGMLRPRGRIAWCCSGALADADGLDRLRWIEGELLGHAAMLLPEGLALLATGSFDPTPLLRRRIGLADAAIALSTGRPADLDGTLVVVGDEGLPAVAATRPGSATG